MMSLESYPFTLSHLQLGAVVRMDRDVGSRWQRGRTPDYNEVHTACLLPIEGVGVLRTLIRAGFKNGVK